jgi:hypothetical protein
MRSLILLFFLALSFLVSANDEEETPLQILKDMSYKEYPPYFNTEANHPTRLLLLFPRICHGRRRAQTISFICSIDCNGQGVQLSTLSRFLGKTLFSYQNSPSLN